MGRATLNALRWVQHLDGTVVESDSMDEDEVPITFQPRQPCTLCGAPGIVGVAIGDDEGGQWFCYEHMDLGVHMSFRGYGIEHPEHSDELIDHSWRAALRSLRQAVRDLADE